MPPRTTSIERLRTFGIVAHVDAGKTSLTERLLHATGRIHTLGAVDAGNTVTDSDPREQARGITIGAAAVTLAHRGHELTLVDTPGHVDFSVEVARSLRVLDAAVVVLDAVAGVEPQTEAVWARADEHGLPRLVFVNKVDRPGADVARAIDMVATRFGVLPVALVVPDPRGGGLVDLLLRRCVVAGARSLDDAFEPPPELSEFVRAGHERIVEVLADVDDEVLSEVVERGYASEETLLVALRRSTLARRIVPVLSGSAKAGLGVGTLLDLIIAVLPSPLDRPALEPEQGVHVPPLAHAPLVAYAFKSLHDEFGQRSFVRVYAGTLRKGASVVAARSGRSLRIGRLAHLFGESVEDVESAGPGEIVALLGLGLETGETLSDPARVVSLEPVVVPPPVLGVALEPKTADDRSRLGPALRRLLSDDPSLVLATDRETGQTVLSGVGELHLEVTLDKLREAKVDVRASQPRVAFRETITKKGEVEETVSKQNGGPGMYAQVRLRVTPAARGAGVSFVDASEGGVVPRPFIPAVEAGAREAAAAGVLAGHPVDDVVVTLLGGAAHSHDSSEHAFHLAGRLAFVKAVREAGPALLEPIMRLSVVVPEQHLGDVLGDLAARRARVEQLVAEDVRRVIVGRAPFAELLGWVTELRSRTQGRGTATMELAGYALAPERAAASIPQGSRGKSARA